MKILLNSWEFFLLWNGESQKSRGSFKIKEILSSIFFEHHKFDRKFIELVMIIENGWKIDALQRWNCCRLVSWHFEKEWERIINNKFENYAKHDKLSCLKVQRLFRLAAGKLVESSWKWEKHLNVEVEITKVRQGRGKLRKNVFLTSGASFSSSESFLAKSFFNFISFASFHKGNFKKFSLEMQFQVIEKLLSLFCCWHNNELCGSFTGKLFVYWI